jgi:hypothetical protein
MVSFGFLHGAEFGDDFVMQCLTGFLKGDIGDQAQGNQADENEGANQLGFESHFIQHGRTFLFAG